MNFSPSGIGLLESLEGFCATPYQDVAGYWTIGYGCRIDNPAIYPNGITQQAAEAMLLDRVAPVVKAISSLVTSTLTQNQFDALVCFIYNIGIFAFSQSTMLHMLNAGQFQDAADQFQRWDRAGGQAVQGLLNRRLKERALFIS